MLVLELMNFVSISCLNTVVIDQCATNGGLGPCDQFCSNTNGSFYCSCRAGYFLSGYTCNGTVVHSCAFASLHVLLKLKCVAYFYFYLAEDMLKYLSAFFLLLSKIEKCSINSNIGFVIYVHCI